MSIPTNDKTITPPSFIQFNSSPILKEGGDIEETEMSSLSSERNLISETKIEKQPLVRMYYADWIRVISVHSVIFVHCLLNAADTTDLKDRDAIEKKEGICKVMAQLGMPLFFYISGMSSTFFNANKQGYVSYVKSKV